nr:5-nucleotidase superfamily protein [Mimivirus sp.]
MIGPYNIFRNIVQNILNNILLGNYVYIITARNKTNQNLSVITNHLVKAGLEKYLNDITILFSEGSDKTKLLHKYKINDFYDDSCLRIIELYTSQKKINYLI